MIFNICPILASFDSPEPQLKLFQSQPGVTGFLILIIFASGIIVWFGYSFLSYLRKKRLEQFPTILGDPRNMLEQVCSVVSLGSSDRYLLNKVACRMRLPQPASLLLSPALLVEAAKTWKKTHRFTLTQNWGINRLDAIAVQVFGKSLSDLGFKN
jgi:hypothetical protein